MANKRSLKKEINEKIYGIIDDCFSAEMDNPEKNGKDANAVVDEAVELRNSLISKMNDRKVKKSNKETKEHFNQIAEELSKGAAALRAKVDKLA